MAVSVLEVLITGNATQLNAALAQGAVATKTFQTSATAAGTRASSAFSTMGRTLTNALSSPIGLLAGGALIGAIGKLTLGFEDSFTRIAALSNASSADIEQWKGQVLSLAGETAQAPQELADALFFLSSAGLDAAQVMPALKASAEGAAVGLGSVKDVANITASAMNAYAKSGLTAAQVTDTLVAAVREGRAEPDEFANALGRILPIASQANVSFQDVTASLASLSNIGLDVNEGVTAMRGVLQAIVAPGTQAAQALGQIGLTAQDMLDAIDERGLFGALQMLDEAAKANTSTQADYIGILRKVVPNVRALTGVLGLTGQEAAKVDAIFGHVTDSTGSLAQALAETAEGPGFKLRQLMAELQVVAIQLGEALLPVVTTLAGVLTQLAPLFEIAAKNAVLFGGALAAIWAFNRLPALLFSIGIGIESLGAAQAASSLGNLAASMATIATVAGPAMVIAMVAVGAALYVNAQNAAKMRAELEGIATDATFATWARDAIAGFSDLGDKTIAAAVILDTLRKKAEAAGLEGFDPLKTAIQSTLAALAAGEISIPDATGLLQQFGLTAGQADVAVAAAVPTLGEFARATNQTGEEAAKAADKLQEYRDALLDLSGGLIGIIHAQQDVRSALADVNRLQAQGKTRTQEYTDAQFTLIEAQLALEQKLRDQASAMRDAGVTGTELRQKLREIAIQAGLTREQFQDLWTRTNGLRGALNSLPKNVRVQINTNAEQARNSVDSLNNSIQALPPSTVLDIKTHVHGSDLPDEVLRKHLWDPLRRGGFKKVGDAWTLPLDVAANSAIAIGGDRAVSPVTPGDAGSDLLQTLRRLEREQLDVLKDIRKSLAHRGGGVPTSGGGGSGGGSGGSQGGVALPASPINRAIESIFELTKKAGATAGEAAGVVKRIAQQGPDNAFIKKVIDDARKELGPVAAKEYASALHILDQRTKTNSKHQEDAIKAALKMLADGMKRNRDMTFGPRDEGWADFVFKNVPRLPEGHTRIDPNLHNRDRRDRPIRVFMDRQHFDREGAYLSTYRGFD